MGNKKHKHAWELYRKRLEQKNAMFGDIIFSCRKCACGADQVKQDGPMGRGDWRPLSDGCKTEWEKERFDNATIEAL